MATNIIRGARYFVHGLRLITRPGLRRFVIIPLLINILVFSIAITLGINWFSDVMQSLLPDWLDWLRWLLWPLFALALLLVVFFCFSLLANIIAAPFNALLAAHVERHLTGTLPGHDTGWKQTLVNALPTMLAETRKALYFILWTIPFLLLYLIPVVNIAAPFVWFAFSAWMLSVEYHDYPADNHDVRFAELRAQLRQRKFVTLGYGSMVLLFTMIPVINFIAMPAAVAGATASWLELASD